MVPADLGHTKRCDLLPELILRHDRQDPNPFQQIRVICAPNLTGASCDCRFKSSITHILIMEVEISWGCPLGYAK